MIGLGLQELPTLNAALNAASAACVVAGLIAIKRKRERRHKRWMLTAVALSTAFLVSYVIYHTTAEPKANSFDGWVRTAYLAMLFSHVVLAMVVVPLVVVTVVLALRDSRAKHRRLARWTLPIWLYVSVTGVLVYLSLYVFQ